MTYVSGLRRVPRTLTVEEQAALLRTTGKHRDTFRDHVIYALALGTALREHEIAALDVGDVAELTQTYRGVVRIEKVRRRIKLRVYKRARKPKKPRRGRAAAGGAPAVPQEVFLPDSVWAKLGRFLSWKRKEGEALTPAAPLFCGRGGARLATRTMRWAFGQWQTAAAFDGRYTFHELRHTAITLLHRDTGGDLRMAQKFARHTSVDTTQIYTHVSDDELFAAVRRLGEPRRRRG